jgi:hypothetical protein
MMNEELTEKSQECLDGDTSFGTHQWIELDVLRGVGYALLALAKAVSWAVERQYGQPPDEIKDVTP